MDGAAAFAWNRTVTPGFSVQCDRAIDSAVIRRCRTRGGNPDRDVDSTAGSCRDPSELHTAHAAHRLLRSEVHSVDGEPQRHRAPTRSEQYEEHERRTGL